MLRERILSRRYGAGEMLPSEQELVNLFGVSRTTVRYAMAALESQGLIEKRQGVGTFVAPHPGTATPLHTSMSDVLTHIRQISDATTAKVVEFDYQRAPKHVCDRLKCAEDQLFQRAVRVRFLRKKPIIQVTSYVPAAIGERFGPNDLERKPLYAMMEEAGLHFASGEQRVTATLAGPTAASRLEIDVGAPLVRIDRFHFDGAGNPVVYVEILAVPQYFELRMTLGEGAI